MSAARELADRILEATASEKPIRTMFASVTDATAGAIRVRPDGQTSGDLGPLELVCGKVAVTDRVLCLEVQPKIWVVVGR